MISAFITWCSVVSLVCVILLARIIVEFFNHRKRDQRHIIRFSNEREMLFVPGDCLDEYEDDYNSSEEL